MDKLDETRDAPLEELDKRHPETDYLDKPGSLVVAAREQERRIVALEVFKAYQKYPIDSAEGLALVACAREILRGLEPRGEY